MSQSVRRIAFVAEDDNALVRRLACGVSRFATPDRGFITREFFLNKGASRLSESCELWNPDAVVSFLGGERVDLLQAAGEGGRPVVNTARCQLAPGRGVVLGDAEEAYDAIHACFQKLGRSHIVQYILDEGAVAASLRARYRQYTDAHHLQFESFAEFRDAIGIPEIQRIKTVDQQLTKMLEDLPKPAGIFTQNSFAGNLLCHYCKLLGIQVPDEIAIIGTDGFDVAVASNPPLTTFRVPAEPVGFEAARIVAGMLDGEPAPQEIIRVSGIRLIERESTGKLASQSIDIDAAQRFIYDHACEGVKVNDVLSHTQGVSRMTFHKRFTEATGMSPAEAIRVRKMSEARRLLAETKLSIGTVAGMCGYNDDLYFSQCFRKVEGVSPRTYRQMQQAGFTKTNSPISSQKL